MQVTVTAFKSNPDKYLNLAQTEDIWITKRGKVYRKLVNPNFSNVAAFSGALAGLVPADLDRDAIREERLADMMAKYAALERPKEERKMNTEMRRKDRQLTDEEAIALLKNGEYGIVSVVCPDGTPYGRPTSYAYADGVLYFHGTAEDSLFRRCIQHEPRACFTVVGETQVLPAKFSTKYESVVAFGTISECPDKHAGLMKLVEKYSPEYLEAGSKYADSAPEKVAVYAMQIESFTGKARRKG